MQQRGEGDAAAALGPWFHNLHLPDGRRTAPDHPLGDFPARKWRQIAPHLPDRLDGWRALDVGCNAGFYSFELARRGADVIGIDSDRHFLRQAEWAAQQLGVGDGVRFRQMHVYDLAGTGERFDIILFMGVFYHLRYPQLALDVLAAMTERRFIFQTLTMNGRGDFADTDDRELEEREVLHDRCWPKMAFIEQRFAGDPTNWWVPNHAACLAMLRSAGLRVVRTPGHEIYICEPDPAGVAWDRSELDAATGARPGTGEAPLSSSGEPSVRRIR